ncbi:protein LYK5 [Sesamum alatum]|uniref:Protein LYK5 n=1 Tax=Sesamum alatum TaxID=300844 RepID=A0AAE1YFI8_9LAMI|nr:protein LYK5 [Sesamum alatum]
MNWILKILITLILFPPCINSQQKYSGNAVFDCNITDGRERLGSSLYTCNGRYSSCRAFLIFRAKFPYNTVPVIATLTSSDIAEIAKINNVTSFTVFPEEKGVIVPVNCSCSGQYYQASTTYQVPVEHQTYYVIANSTFQGLTTCDSLKHANDYSEFSLLPGNKLLIPLRCACPTTGQTAAGTEFLLTYSIGHGDTLYTLSRRFNVSVKSISEANSFSDDSRTIYPFTTVLIPLPSEPSSSHTVSRSDHVTTTSPLPAPVDRKSRRNRVLPTAGIAAGALSLLILFILVPIYLFHKKRNQFRQSRGRNAKVSSPQDLILELARFDQAVKVFKFSEIKKATDNFGTKNRIKGCVYRGTFRREVLAVKKSNGNADSEVKLLYQINHLNIVKLHGFCEHKDNLYLVYEYMENGTLQEWLSRRESEDEKSWNKRIHIALDVANGLLYLHSFTNPAYVHNDIRSSNILLNGNLRAKIANFSLAVKANFNGITRVVGSRGYMAPECLEAGPVTPKVDVFAFGVVLLELITGKYPVFMQDGRERLLTTTVAAIMQSQDAETELSHFIAPGLGENGGIQYAIQVVKLSLSCFRQDPADRPDMAEVVSTLLKVQFNIHKPLLSKQRN